MAMTRWAGVSVLGLVLVVGCQRSNRQPQAKLVARPMPATVPVAVDNRKQLQQASPTALIGQIVAVLPKHGMVSVADLPVNKFQIGDVICLVGEEGLIGTGKVLAIRDGKLHVQYTNCRRVPVVGDLGVRFDEAKPKAIVGQVTEVVDKDKLATIEKVPAESVKEGDIMLFMGNEGTIATGTIKEIARDKGEVKVLYTPMRRAPGKGDLAVPLVERKP